MVRTNLTAEELKFFRMPPGQNMDDIMTIFKSGMWRLYYKFSNEGRKRFFNEFFPLLNSTKYSLSIKFANWFCRATVLAEREAQSWYLVYLGTRLNARGKGYARKLVEHVTAQVIPFPRKSCVPKRQNWREGVPLLGWCFWISNISWIIPSSESYYLWEDGI